MIKNSSSNKKPAFETTITEVGEFSDSLAPGGESENLT